MRIQLVMLVVGGCAVGTEAPVPPENPGGPGDGLAATPPMGWSSWNAFGCDVDEALIEEQADALVASGLAALGYRYVNIDDCWQAKERSPDGELLADPERFPHGIAAVADYVHARGLLLGIYSSPGEHTCKWNPGSRDYPEEDAQLFADWGVDYLKYDGCYATWDEKINGFIAMHDAIEATGRPIVLSINPNGAKWRRPWSEVAHLWRTTPDIKPVWSAECSWWCGILEITKKNAQLARDARPGAWNDPDMLEVGVATDDGALSDAEGRLHFSLWAIMAAPLIAGADLATMTPETLAILGNAEVVAVDQDRLGAQGWVVRDEGDAQVWMRPLADPGARAVAMVNYSEERRLMTIRWNEIQLDSGPAQLRDLWAHADLGIVDDAYTVEIPPHDVVMLRVDGHATTEVHEAEEPASVRTGTKTMRCAACSGAQKVGYLGRGSTLTFSAIAATAGTHTLTIRYSAAEERTLFVRSGADTVRALRLPSTGGFDLPQELEMSIQLDGAHTIELSNPDDWAPDIDQIRIE
jgi:alpha-galactosidase